MDVIRILFVSLLAISAIVISIKGALSQEVSDRVLGQKMIDLGLTETGYKHRQGFGSRAKAPYRHRRFRGFGGK